MKKTKQAGEQVLAKTIPWGKGGWWRLRSEGHTRNPKVLHSPKDIP